MMIKELIISMTIFISGFILLLSLIDTIYQVPKAVKSGNAELIYTKTVKIIVTLYILSIIYYIAILIK